jgi:hypothetical protein
LLVGFLVALAAGIGSLAIAVSTAPAAAVDASCDRGFVAPRPTAGTCPSASGPAADAAGAPGSIQSVDASGKIAQRPKRFRFAKHVVVRHLRWKAWTEGEALAKGRLRAPGFEPTDARLHLSRPAACDAGMLFLEARLKLAGGANEKRNYDCFC